MNESESKRDWRRAVRVAMQEAACLEERDCNGESEPAFGYRWEHVMSVVTLALRLARLVGADLEIVEAAAWLHDVAKTEGEDHPELGADYARHFLPKTDFPVEKIESVAKAIAWHKGLWRDEPLTDLEAMVLWDADKLSKMGLTAVVHWTGMALSGGEPVTTAGLVAKGHNAEWMDSTAASMHTAPARQAAEGRLLAFRRFWDRLEAELRGDDLV